MNSGSTQEMKWLEAVEFLLRLASTGDPKELREWERLRLIEDLRRFMEIEGEVKGKLATQLDEVRNNPAVLKPVINVVRQLANAAADRDCVSIGIGRTLLIFDGARRDDDRVPVFSHGSLKDVMANLAAGDLGRTKSWQIGRCPWPECGKLFLADRKGQMYCSHKCASAASSDSYQKRKAKAFREAEKKDGHPKKKKSAVKGE